DRQPHRVLIPIFNGNGLESRPAMWRAPPTGRDVLLLVPGARVRPHGQHQLPNARAGATAPTAARSLRPSGELPARLRPRPTRAPARPLALARCTVPISDGAASASPGKNSVSATGGASVARASSPLAGT